MRPVILLRPHNPLDTTEGDVAARYFDVYRHRTDIPPGSLVIGRYSVLPFYKDLEYDLNNRGSKLINSHMEHQYAADLQNWYQDLMEYTPQTWDRLENLPDKGPFVLKGETNSKKELWRTHMYAENKQEAVKVYLRLQEDSLISTQKIYIRKYIPLVNYGMSLEGRPISKEFRFFLYKGMYLSGAFYWSSHINDIGKVIDQTQVPQEFLNKVGAAIASKITFAVVDVAQTQSGDWIVIEVNDAQMSGLSENNPDDLYKGLKTELNLDRAIEERNKSAVSS